MMFKAAIFSSILLVAALDSVSAAKLKCEHHEAVLKSGSCDGTCTQATPPCVFTKILKDRCGCAPGRVRNQNNYCRPVYRCPNRENLPTQCELESLFNKEIKCSDDGLFVPKQVVGGVSKCVVPETGTTLPGKVNLSGGDVDCEEMSACQLAYIDQALFHYNHVDAMDGPNVQCGSNGHYKRRQCYSYTSYCYCVNPKTGTPIPGLDSVGPRFHCKKVKLTNCQQEFVDVDKANLHNSVDLPLPTCSSIDGNYPAVSCDDAGICQCRNRETGEFLPGRGANIECIVLTTCQQQHTSGVPAEQIKSCDADGRFFTKFCNDEFCECIDANSGDAVQGIDKVPISEARDLKCPTPTCPSNMEYQTCAGCDRTCKNKDQMLMCTMMCRSKCACPGETVWSKTDAACVPEEFCGPPKIVMPKSMIKDIPVPPPIGGGMVIPPPLEPVDVPPPPPIGLDD